MGNKFCAQAFTRAFHFLLALFTYLVFTYFGGRFYLQVLNVQIGFNAMVSAVAFMLSTLMPLTLPFFKKLLLARTYKIWVFFNNNGF